MIASCFFPILLLWFIYYVSPLIPQQPTQQCSYYVCSKRIYLLTLLQP